MRRQGNVAPSTCSGCLLFYFFLCCAFSCPLIIDLSIAGPDGAMSASRYAYMGGFDGTSNVLAGFMHNIPVKGTHAHSFVMSFTQLEDLQITTIRHATSGEDVEFVELVLAKKLLLPCAAQGNEGELAAFISYAQAFPSGFLALVDTYDSLLSGTPNYLAVGWALHEVGYSPRGIRLDSGDLAYLSMKVRLVHLLCCIFILSKNAC